MNKPGRKEVSKIMGVIALGILLASCLAQPKVVTQGIPTLVATPELPTIIPTLQPSATATATETLQPTETVEVSTDWSAIRCVPKSAEDISRCPQSPSLVTEKDKFISWFAKWAQQMDILRPGPSVAYGAAITDQYGSDHYIITVASEGVAGTFWFAGENGQKVLVIVLANGIVKANNLYQGQYNLIVLVDKTSYKDLTGGLISQDEEIACIQPNVSAYVTTLNMTHDGDQYLEKAVAENFTGGGLADGSTIKVGFIWKLQKF